MTYNLAFWFFSYFVFIGPTLNFSFVDIDESIFTIPNIRITINYITR